uniref:Uncharacterized protein n=1 Tax=Arion vulgaris TaxID=1028688 RepID=A0A0B6ZFS1_9EUPU
MSMRIQLSALVDSHSVQMEPPAVECNPDSMDVVHILRLFAVQIESTAVLKVTHVICQLGYVFEVVMI